MIQALTGLFEGLWRRWYGGWYPFGKPSDSHWYHKRWFQYLVNGLVVAAVLAFVGLEWWKILIAVAVLLGFFWGKGHGACYDLGHHGKPDEGMIERYKKCIGYKVACKIFPKSLWYTYWFDVFLMFVRYETPAVVLAVFTSWWVVLAGFGVTLSYMLGWFLEDKGCKFLGSRFKGLCSSATNFGELLGGFITGITLTI